MRLAKLLSLFFKSPKTPSALNALAFLQIFHAYPLTRTLRIPESYSPEYITAGADNDAEQDLQEIKQLVSAVQTIKTADHQPLRKHLATPEYTFYRGVLMPEKFFRQIIVSSLEHLIQDLPPEITVNFGTWLVLLDDNKRFVNAAILAQGGNLRCVIYSKQYHAHSRVERSSFPPGGGLYIPGDPFVDVFNPSSWNSPGVLADIVAEICNDHTAGVAKKLQQSFLIHEVLAKHSNIYLNQVVNGCRAISLVDDAFGGVWHRPDVISSFTKVESKKQIIGNFSLVSYTPCPIFLSEKRCCPTL